MTDFDVIVLGGGAAGLMCALTAGQRGRRVLVLEHAEVIGRKIAISGGGRCNFTNIHAQPDNYISQQPAFCISALARYTPADFLELVERHRIAYHEKKLGQQFCDGSARQVTEMLLAECAEGNVVIKLGCDVHEVRKLTEFAVETSLGSFTSSSVVVATGGLSFAKLGATDFGHRLARQFEIALTEIRPALVPLKFAEEELAHFHELSGISLDSAVRHRGVEFRENLLVTHRGLSGPAILQISSYWREGESVTIDLLPELDATAWLFTHREEPVSLDVLLSRRWSRRFAETWSARHGDSKKLPHLSAERLREIGALLNGWRIPFPASEGYAKAEVTLGGVDTRELSSKTMECRKVAGLYFIGEVVDVTGWLGGYNFQWAWASGHAAGESA
ncbi:MAG: hypothetical protein QOD99_2480 [Chthoniobacter sp.]|jgi:predicted Rossmann fold flavoprotein|nr:hypothetical protein [Chthoniobacter sp.]